jgi:1-acyl-sn-glycerol-3-phosphate acyltransferase
LTVGILGLALLAGDLIQRTVVAGTARLLPARRIRILAAWQRGLAHLVLRTVSIVGGARFSAIPRIPGEADVLVLMNHQSLIDIPLVVRALRGNYPRIVTRARYARGKPLISHMVRLYQYPTVEPRATVRGDVLRLGESAAASPVPVVIYPEGTRTRTGEIGPFRRAGLQAVLSARSWEVWLLVADGTWRSARLADFLSRVGTIHARTCALGPFPSPPAGADVDAVIDDMRERMVEALAELRTPA